MAKQRYPIGVQTFSEIRENGYVYVDKTQYVHRLVTGSKCYFLSRPRRFGKSVLLSTLEAYFEGRRDLFKGLVLDSLTDDWEPHPVLHLDLNVDQYSDPGTLEKVLNNQLVRWERVYGDDPSEQTLPLRFAGVIRRAHERTGRKAVVLVDEYDKPLLAAMDDPALQDRYRAILKGFYGNLKSQDRHLRFAMLTGVTRFSKISIFSDLNNLDDISMSRDYACCCGITGQELARDFAPGVADLAAQNGMTPPQALERLRRDYDGYRFAPGQAQGLYNPFSVLNAMSKREFGSYWFATGTPTFLVDLIRRDRWRLSELENAEALSSSLLELATTITDPVPIMFQSGYLTIKDYEKRFETYWLHYPNTEVREGFIYALSRRYLPGERGGADFDVRRFVKDVEAGRAAEFMERLNAMFAAFPYEQIPDRELHFQNALYLVFTIMGFYTRVEYHTSDGRADMVVQTPERVYEFEFKYDRPAAEAMEQIERKAYAAPFLASGKQIIKIGASFLPETRRLEWIIN